MPRRSQRGKGFPTLLLLEHPHVYTFGRMGHAENLLLGSGSNCNNEALRCIGSIEAAM